MTTRFYEMPYNPGLGRPEWPTDAEGKSLIQGHGAIGVWPPPGATGVVGIVADDDGHEAIRAMPGVTYLEDQALSRQRGQPVERVGPGGEAGGRVLWTQANDAQLIRVLARCGVTPGQYRASGGRRLNVERPDRVPEVPQG